MATRGRKRQTNAQKIAKGETRPSQLSANVLVFPTLEKAPAPPNWLNSEGVVLWEKIAPLLFAQRVLSEVDLEAMAHLCQLHGEIVDGYRRRVLPTAAQLSQLRMYFSEFGLTPSSRTRVGPTAPPDEKNRFSSNGKRGRGADD